MPIATAISANSTPNHNFNLISDFWKHIFYIIASIFRATNITLRALHLTYYCFVRKYYFLPIFLRPMLIFLQKFNRSLIFLALNRGFFAGLRAARPEFNERRLIVRWLGGEHPIDAWICAEDALGHFFEARIIDQSVAALVIFGRPGRFGWKNDPLFLAKWIFRHTVDWIRRFAICRVDKPSLCNASIWAIVSLESVFFDIKYDWFQELKNSNKRHNSND